MINHELEKSFGIAGDIVPTTRLKEFSNLAAQILPQERETLYAATRYVYTGEGDVWDIGCAAGGSSFCLAAGLHDNESLVIEIKNARKIKCFDLFGGYSGNAFKMRFADTMSDLEIFHAQTASVRDFVLPVKMDLITDLDSYTLERPIELAHIDAAKSLPLWKSIFKKIGSAIIPGKTIWVYQDFERCRLPWQVYTLFDLMNFGEIIGGSNFGTVYFKFNSAIDDQIYRKIVADDFPIEEKLNNVRSVFSIIKSNHMSFFENSNFTISDLENTSLAYCYYWNNNKKQAQAVMSNSSSAFLSLPGTKVYTKEIFG